MDKELTKEEFTKFYLDPSYKVKDLVKMWGVSSVTINNWRVKFDLPAKRRKSLIIKKGGKGHYGQ